MTKNAANVRTTGAAAMPKACMVMFLRSSCLRFRSSSRTPAYTPPSTIPATIDVGNQNIGVFRMVDEGGDARVTGHETGHEGPVCDSAGLNARWRGFMVLPVRIYFCWQRGRVYKFFL